MKYINAAMFLGFLACTPALASDLYRCDMVNGKTTYQGTQCGMDAQQRAIDPKNARREQIRKSLEQERHKQEKAASEKGESA